MWRKYSTLYSFIRKYVKSTEKLFPWLMLRICPLFRTLFHSEYLQYGHARYDSNTNGNFSFCNKNLAPYMLQLRDFPEKKGLVKVITSFSTVISRAEIFFKYFWLLKFEYCTPYWIVQTISGSYSIKVECSLNKKFWLTFR